MIGLKKNKILIIIIFIIIVLIIPLIVHCLFKLKSNGFFTAEWSAGEFLQFYSSILSFISTLVLSGLALWQNKIIKDESDKRLELQDKIEYERNMPKFYCALHNISFNGKKATMILNLHNISNNIATNIEIYDTMILDINNTIIWEYKEITLYYK